jgi:hypothetical protein
MKASRTNSTNNPPPLTENPAKNQNGISNENGMANANNNRGRSSPRNPCLNKGCPQPRKRKHFPSGNKKGKFSRNWEASTRRDRNVDTQPLEGEEEKEERRPKKKVACFIGYSGEGYHGMQ